MDAKQEPLTVLDTILILVNKPNQFLNIRAFL